MIKCSKCKKNIDPLEVFPNGLCVDCYEKQFNEQVKRTGKLPKPDFLRALRF